MLIKNKFYDIVQILVDKTFIHNGKILLSTSKDDLMYKYGVLQCKSSQFEQVNKKDISL